MISKATVKGIAASGGIRPDSHITACPVTAIKAGPVAHTLSGQRSYTDERLALEIPVAATSRSGGRRLKPCEELQSSCADFNLGNPCVEKVLQHRSRQSFGMVMKAADIKSVKLGSSRCGFAQPCQNKGAASLTKAHGAFRKIGEAVNRQGTLTITGSNVRLGTEMPVALSLF